MQLCQQHQSNNRYWYPALDLVQNTELRSAETDMSGVLDAPLLLVALWVLCARAVVLPAVACRGFPTPLLAWYNFWEPG